MSEPAVKQRLRRARARIMTKWAAKGWDIYFDCAEPYRLLASKRGQTRIINVEAEVSHRTNQNISVK